MAITIVDQPTAFAKVGQKLMIVATSTNVAQPNFRYVVRIYFDYLVLTQDIIVPPNTFNRLMFDLRSVVHPFVPVNGYNSDSLVSYISTQSLVNQTELTNCMAHITVSVLEAYNVAGTFTINEESIEEIGEFYIINAKYSTRDGYKPDPNLVYSFTSTTSLLLGGRKANTHIPKDNPYLTASSQRVFIPVRRNELDWGTLAAICQGVDNGVLITTEEPQIRMTIYSSTGAPSIVAGGSFLTEDISFLGVYPANLNAHGELLRPADFPNWRWYEIAMYDSTNTTRKSAVYTFYPVDVDCLHDNVRLGWWDAENGGFDFFNFTKKNEQTVEVERTRVQKVVGSYNSTTFTFAPSDHELAEGDIAVRTYLDINSDYIQEGEFALLKRLITSPLVYIVEDSGTLIPVLVDTNSYTSKKTRDGKLYNVSIRLRYSNELM